MSPSRVRLQMSRIEGAQLAQLVDDFRDLVGSERDLDDPAIGRLAPDAYPDDEDASHAFRDATRADLLDRRALDADVVKASLAPLRADIESLSEEEAFVTHDVSLGVDDVDPWLRTVTALRLVIAARLGIESDDDHDPEDPRYAVYDWLGYRLEVMIQAADELL